MRISKIQYYLDIAFAVSKRSTCLKRHYGAIIVKDDRIVSTGYNGSPRGDINCCDTGICPRMDIPHNSGNYANCKAVHAEQNAIISASRDELKDSTLYLACEEFIDGKWIRQYNISPCPICEKMIINSGITKTIFK